MEPSYYQNGILLLSKGTLLLKKGTPIKMEPSICGCHLLACLLACMLADLGPSSNTLHSSFLVLVLYHSVLVSGRMELICMPWMILQWFPLKNIFLTTSTCLFFDSRITPVAPVGLWTLSPRFSAV